MLYLVDFADEGSHLATKQRLAMVVHRDLPNAAEKTVDLA